jgi:hypothetical protein
MSSGRRAVTSAMQPGRGAHARRDVRVQACAVTNLAGEIVAVRACRLIVRAQFRSNRLAIHVVRAWTRTARCDRAVRAGAVLPKVRAWTHWDTEFGGCC